MASLWKEEIEGGNKTNYNAYQYADEENLYEEDEDDNDNK
jgi:hypothetical protein